MQLEQTFLLKQERRANQFCSQQNWCPGGESNPHEEKSPEDFKSSASAIPPPGQCLKINDLQ